MLLIVLVFVLGLCVGSFTNVLIFRLPESQSVVRPGSRCRTCHRRLAWHENVPVASFLALRGRCRGCGTRISVQYPLVEIAVGLLFVGNFLLSATSPAAGRSLPEALARPDWLVGASFTTLLLAIALTDLRTYLIPDELSLGGTVLGLLVSLLPGGLAPLQALLGALLGGGLLYAVAWLGALLFRKEAMGGGDIKMMAMVGAFLGWQGVFLTLFLGSLLGSLIYGPISLARRWRTPLATDPRGRAVDGATVAASARTASAAASPTTAAASVEPAMAAPVSAAPDLSEAASGGGEEEVDRALVPFGLFLAPAAALAFYLADELVRAYLRLVGLES